MKVSQTDINCKSRIVLLAEAIGSADVVHRHCTDRFREGDKLE